MGKSVLAANAIEHILENRVVDEQHGVGFMYYNYRRSEDQDLTHLIRTLLKQLCRDHAKPPYHLLRQKQESRSVGSQDDFLAVAERYTELYIVVDGLDESLATRRHEVIGFLKAITQLPFTAKILLTSRYEVDISDGLNGNGMRHLALEGSSNASDIHTYIQHRVHAMRSGGDSTRLRIESGHLIEEVIEVLSQKSQGLYVSCSCAYLLRS